MSADYYRQQAQRIQENIARLQHDRAREGDKLAQLSQRINAATQQVGRTKSASIISSKMAEIARCRDEESRVYKRIADIEAKISREQTRLTSTQRNLSREEGQEQRRRQQEATRQASTHRRQLNEIGARLAKHDSLHNQTLAAFGRLTQVPESIVVLFFASNPLDQPRLRLDEEVRLVTEMIRKSEHRDSVRLVSCWAVRPLDVLQALNEHRPHVVHFSGHGTNQDEIVLQDDAGQARFVGQAAITETMAAASGSINLVFFNTCFSRSQAKEVTRHIPAAIGMKTSISDEAARIFSAQFYSSIGFGLSVQRAFNQAKVALMMEGIDEADTPELFIADGVEADELMLVQQQ